MSAHDSEIIWSTVLDAWRFSMMIGTLGGSVIVDIVHVVVSFALTPFLFIHIYLSTPGGTAMQHITAMIT